MAASKTVEKTMKKTVTLNRIKTRRYLLLSIIRPSVFLLNAVVPHACYQNIWI